MQLLECYDDRTGIHSCQPLVDCLHEIARMNAEALTFSALDKAHVQERLSNEVGTPHAGSTGPMARAAR